MTYESKSKHAARPGLRTQMHANLSQKEMRLLTVLHREIEFLMLASFKAPLEKFQSEALIQYMKLVKDLKKKETEELGGLSDAELEKLAQKKL